MLLFILYRSFAHFVTPFKLAIDSAILLCYARCGVHIHLLYFPGRSGIIELTGPAESAGIYDKYLVLFHRDFVEIRNLDDGKLKQVTYGEEIRYLDDGA
jgi:hypothetical protein